jgi:malonate decarboxylase beta subunit
MRSYLESTARERLLEVVDDASFDEFLPPEARVISPHLDQLNAAVSFDDGVAVGSARLAGAEIAVAAQEGGFMGGAVGEVHGAKLVGLLRGAIERRSSAVLLLLETGGVRLHEANAGLIAVSEVMRAVLDARAAGIPVVAMVGGSNGCFGGMGIVARCCNAIIMSEEGRLAMSGPEVIETANGVEEFDSRDRALVWRTTGGKHRYLLGDCQRIVADSIAAFREAAIAVIAGLQPDAVSLSLRALEREHQLLTERVQRFGAMDDPVAVWEALGMAQPAAIPLMEAAAFVSAAQNHRLGAA